MRKIASNRDEIEVPDGRILMPSGRRKCSWRFQQTKVPACANRSPRTLFKMLTNAAPVQ
jgi:hypothetical protein